MKRMAILTATVTLLLLGSVSMLTTAPTVAQTGGADLPSWYTVEQGMAAGGGYHLTSLTWQVCGTTSGEGYQLQGPVRPALRGNGCCCTYLPLILRNLP